MEEFTQIKNIYLIPICIYNNFQKSFNGKASILLKKNEYENFEFINLKINQTINLEFFNNLEFTICNKSLKIKNLKYSKYIFENDVYIIQHLIYNKENESYQYFPIEDIQLNTNIEKIVKKSIYDIIPFFKKINRSNLIFF